MPDSATGKRGGEARAFASPTAAYCYALFDVTDYSILN
jgi:hypothetical protein